MERKKGLYTTLKFSAHGPFGKGEAVVVAVVDAEHLKPGIVPHVLPSIRL
jgi:hypothetical protein